MIELCLAGALLTAASFGGVRAASVTCARSAARRHAVAPSPPNAPLGKRRELSSLPDLRVGSRRTGTFLGMSDELLLERVRTAPIVRFKLNHGGSSLSFRAEFADGSRAAWKPMQTNMQSVPRKEVAAYRLNRLLGLHAVPPAAPRAVTREELFGHLHPESLEKLPRIKAETVFGPDGRTIGTASYWIPVIKDSGFDTPEGRRQTPGVADAGPTDPARPDGDGGAGVELDRVRLPDLEPRPLLGRQHEDVARRQAAVLHGQHDVVLRRRRRQRAQPRRAVQDATVLARALPGARLGRPSPTCSARSPRSWARPTRS